MDINELISEIEGTEYGEELLDDVFTRRIKTVTITFE